MAITAEFGASFSPDDRTVATGSGDRTVRMWTASGRQEIPTLRGHTLSINSVDFSPTVPAQLAGDQAMSILASLARAYERLSQSGLPALVTRPQNILDS